MTILRNKLVACGIGLLSAILPVSVNANIIAFGSIPQVTNGLYTIDNKTGATTFVSNSSNYLAGPGLADLNGVFYTSDYFQTNPPAIDEPRTRQSRKRNRGFFRGKARSLFAVVNGGARLTPDSGRKPLRHYTPTS
jgi:hypothetical protein